MTALLFIVGATSVITLIHGVMLFSKKYYLWFSNNIWKRAGVASHQTETEFMDRYWRGASSIVLGLILGWFVVSALI